MNCKLDKNFENFLKYNSEKTNEISISNQTNNNNTLNNNDFKENIFIDFGQEKDLKIIIIFKIILIIIFLKKIINF